MQYYCELCDYTAKNSSCFSHHKNTKKHLHIAQFKVNKSAKKSTFSSFNVAKDSPNIAIEATKIEGNYNCNFCKKFFKHRSSYYRHKKLCTESNETGLLKELQIKIQYLEKIDQEKTELLKEKTELLNTFMTNANILLNKATDNNKITSQTLQTVSISALKYANEKFKDTPALMPIENFKINNLDFDNENDKQQLVEILIYNAKQKSLDKLLGDHIVKCYKKEDPKDQSFHTTDCSRLNYIIRELIDNALIWSIDKNGIKICTEILKPLIKKCINVLLDHQKCLLQRMANGEVNKQKDVELIIDIIMSIDSGILENDINKYIAPFFNLGKKS